MFVCVDSLWMECKDYKKARDELPCFTRLFYTLFYTLISPNVQASGELNSSLHVLHVFLRGFYLCTPASSPAVQRDAC